MVVARNDAEIFTRVHDVWIARVRDDVARFAPAHAVPVRQMDRAGEAVAGTLGGTEILHRACHPIRTTSVDRHVIELRNRKLRRRPAGAAIAADVHAAIIRHDHSLWVLWIDPDVV